MFQTWLNATLVVPEKYVDIEVENFVLGSSDKEQRASQLLKWDALCLESRVPSCGWEVIRDTGTLTWYKPKVIAVLLRSQVIVKE